MNLPLPVDETPPPPSPPPVERFSPLRPGFRTDPYPFYHYYRTRDPVHWTGATLDSPGAWCLFRYADVMNALSDPRFGKNPNGGKSLAPFAAMRDRSMLSRNPPDHTRLRSLVNKVFAPGMVEALRPRIVQTAERLIDHVAAAGRMDFIADFACPLPVIVIAELFGVETWDLTRFKTWSVALSRAMDLLATPQVYAEADAATLGLSAYLRDAIAERRQRPRADLLSGLIAVEEQGDKLSEEELISMCILLLAAGHETTVNLIGNSLYALLQHPAEMERLRGGTEALRENAVEELLRYDSPVQMSFRMALEDVELHGRRLRRGSEVVIVLGSANRDPAQFPEPDRLDITRKVNAHSAFARGIHFCLGAPLARAEGQIALETVLRRLPNLRFDEADAAPEWRQGFVFHGLETMPLRF